MRVSLFFILILAGNSSFALEQDDIELMNQFAIGGKVQLHQDEWSVDSTKVDRDSHKYGLHQRKDLTDWKGLDSEKWLSLSEWVAERRTKDLNQDWRRVKRESIANELVGRVIKCVGLCFYYHGTKKTVATQQTRLREGDEFVTEENSYAWVLLVDGGLIRISPKTSLSLNEVNIAKSDNFFMLRLNYGHINYQARLIGEYKELNKVETDQLFLPLHFPKANREYFGRIEYQSSKQNISSLLEGNAGAKSQYKKLNESIKSNEDYALKNSHVYIYTANASFLLQNAHLNLFYSLAHSTKFKALKTMVNFRNTDTREQKIEVSFRGYQNKSIQTPLENQWYEMDSSGKKLQVVNEGLKDLDVAETFIQRIPTVLLARESSIRKHSKPLLSPKTSYLELSHSSNYKLWGSGFEKRISYIKEYIRRVETTNLRSMSKLFKNYPEEFFNEDYYQLAMSVFYKKIKNQYSKENMAVREMNDKEYRFWLLRNAK